ncbi:acetyltransferase (GNAT) family protein [Luteibacter rhizovicinus]|uniref:Acetyltransferase (GNAT) family protein n=1 Tax=Luteibacter rhizovicinus TaxID=242606 RepID=A0A4R3YR11_9GAMM|nr:GNAT family N-acetyltransferase [Luteibacter rhizovicinus]TCV94068.1 acetyltransferase (GNAT) family protein [Luteibacter rhizovicinus]
MPFLNQLEPDSLLGHFDRHPPVGFDTLRSKDGMPLFAAPFDLLTTADDALRHRVQGLPLYRFWSRLLRPRTCFAGTTVTEYAVFPAGADPAALAAELRSTVGRAHTLLVVKDIPLGSPLLDASSSDWSQRFVDAAGAEGFITVEGQALAWLPIDFASADDYLSRMSASRRKNLRRKLRSRDELEIEAIPTGTAFADEGLVERFYALYCEVYAQSETHFDLLTLDFFRDAFQDANGGGVVFVYRKDGETIGWNLCYEHQGRLLDKYIGFSYPRARDYNLYFVSWMHNLEYARQRGLTHYVAGWTDPEVKASLGASFHMTRHAVYIRNPLLRFVLRRLAKHFESDRQWQEKHNASRRP